MPLDSKNENRFGSKPVTVSSTSSMETAASSFHNDGTSCVAPQTISANPSLISSIPNPTQADAPKYLSQATKSVGLPNSISLIRNPLRSTGSGMVIPSVASPNAVPEFLYQLTKMLTDNNRDIIEWSNGKIEVHNPHKLQSHVLNRYFRHSKFASFQRQLNYFGFRKLAGKGKMAPCSYVNDATTFELRSLLHIKRKTGNEPKSKAAEKKRVERQGANAGSHHIGASRNHGSASSENKISGTHYNVGNSSTSNSVRVAEPLHSQKALARVAVGKGIRHSFSMPQKSNPTKRTTIHNPIAQPLNNEHLTALASSFQSSLNEEQTLHQTKTSEPKPIHSSPLSALSYVPGSLRRDDSLVDLAMIPIVDGETQDTQNHSPGELDFIDFPWDPSYLSNTDDPT